jgi:hypothetical protein
MQHCAIKIFVDGGNVVTVENYPTQNNPFATIDIASSATSTILTMFFDSTDAIRKFAADVIAKVDTVIAEDKMASEAVAAEKGAA